MQTDAWLALFELTHADLESNRRGVLSERQQRTARAATGADARSMLGISMGAWAMFGGIVWILQTSPHAIRLGEPLESAHYAMIGTGIALPLAATLWTLYAAAVHFGSRADTTVRSTEGPVQKRALRHRHTEVLSISIGAESLDVSARVFERLAEGARYRVFFVPTSRLVVMIEPLDQNSNPPKQALSTP